MMATPPARTAPTATLPVGFGEAVVEGLDIATMAPDAVIVDWLRDLLWTHGVVCVRQAHPLTDELHESLTAMFGPVKQLIGRDEAGRPVRYGGAKQVIDSGTVVGAAERAVMASPRLGGNVDRPGLFTFFHTDDSFVAAPASVTVLHARQLPSGPGGDTCFLDMRVAFEQLGPDERHRLLGLRAVHGYNNHGAFPPRTSAGGPYEELADVRHPIVRAHPVTGRPALYFDLDRARGIDGWDELEGRVLLQSLQDHAEQFAPRHAHRWQPNDVLVWDNASVQHRASGDFAIGEPRRFWRLMVEGAQPEPFAG